MSKPRNKKAQTRAERNIAWCEEFIYLPEGKYVGQKLKMAQFMKDDFIAIFDNPHGTRRAIISRGRKNAKTVEAAILMLIFLVGPEAAPNSQLYSSAMSRDQASILHALASKMCRMNPALMEHVSIKDTAKEIHCPALGSRYKALSSDASTIFGASPRFLVHDELGQVRGPRSELYEALETACSAQESPISIVISTQSAGPQDLLSSLIDDALTGSDPRTIIRFNSAPLDLDTFSEEAIRAANPAYDLFMNKQEVMAQAEDAKRMPSRQSSFENLILNRRVEASNPFVSRSTWLENGEQPEELEGLRVWGGLDLSSVSDLTALVLVSEHGDVHSRFWLPQDGLVEKSRSDRVPYDIWESEGYLLTTPGRSIEYDFIAHELRDLFDMCDVQSIAFDRYNMKFLKPCLERAGFREEELEKFVEFGQGFVSMSPAIRELESKLLQKQLKHGNHPVLTMCAANAITVNDPAGNRKFTKQKSTGRIDGMQALAQAVGIMPQLAEAGDFDGFLMNPVAV